MYVFPSFFLYEFIIWMNGRQKSIISGEQSDSGYDRPQLLHEL